MRRHSFIVSCAAVFLILIFSMKAGAGLFLHDLLHTTTANNKYPPEENKKDKAVNYNCNCIDDFLMPFTAADVPVYSLPDLAFTTQPLFFEENIPLISPVLSLLRGPPAKIV